MRLDFLKNKDNPQAIDRIALISNRAKEYRRNELIELLSKKYLVKEVLLNSVFPSTKILSKKQVIIDIISNTIKLFFLLDKKTNLYVSTGITNAIPILLLNKIFRKKIVLTTFYLHDLGNNKIIKFILRVLLDSRISMVVQSEYEKKYFTEFISLNDIEYIPYCLDIVQEEIEIDGGELPFQRYIFAGGFTNRDYDTLFKAGKDLPYNFVIICSALNKIYDNPKNFVVYYDTSYERFNYVMKNADIVVINLKNQVGSSGQMATLTAMAFGKAIIYVDNPTINHYLVDNISGLMYEAGNNAMLRSHLKKIMSNKNLARNLSRSAQQQYQDNYRKNIEWEKIAQFIKKAYRKEE